MAPPKGNQNARKHGLYGSKLPDNCRSVTKRLNKLWKLIETTIGTLDVSQAATLQLAMDHERHALLAHKWMREGDELSAAERLAFSRDALRSREARNRLLSALGLGDSKAAAGLWQQLQQIRGDE